MNRQRPHRETSTALLAAFAAMALMACKQPTSLQEQSGADTSASNHTETPSTASAQTAAATATTNTTARPRTAPTARMPRGYRQRMMKAVTLNNGCINCHQQQANEWQGSHHQQANINPAYRQAFNIEPTGFCRGCHAPEAIFTETPPEAVSALGVACVTCHVVTEGVVLAALHDRSPASAQLAPHPLQRSKDFAHTAGCSGCHEFHFPGRQGGADEQFMQTTIREHDSSPAADRSCASCHMPLTEGRRSHAFAQVRDEGWLRSNLNAKAYRSDNKLNITIEQPQPGHAFPTGDLFRRLEVGCEWLRADGTVISRQAEHLARHFKVLPNRPQRQLVRDDRLMFTPKTLSFKPPTTEAKASRVRWWVSYQRVATVGSGTDPATASVESAVRLHAGSSPWDDGAAELRKIQ